MKHQLYFPSRQSAQNLWLQHFKSGLPEVAEKLNLPEARVQQTLKDLAWLIHVCGELLKPLKKMETPGCPWNGA